MTSSVSSSLYDVRAPALVNVPPNGPRTSRLLIGIYHDIGMAAVAEHLEVRVDDLESSTVESVRRGRRYISLMPKQQPRTSTLSAG